MSDALKDPDQPYALTTMENAKSAIFRLLGPVAVARAKAILGRESLDEVDIVYQDAKNSGITKGTMIDVGAHYGTSLSRFAADNWKVFAFEPDEHNHAILEKRHGYRSNLHIDRRAVSNEDGKEVTFYDSDVSTGISGLSAFDQSHRVQKKVKLVTLSRFASDNNIDQVDFLKVDTEGHDLFVLEGNDWTALQPQWVVCEFEDKKTKPLGYDKRALYQYLCQQGYNVVISEWYPIEEYGSKHQWKRFTKDIASVQDDGWGNFIAFRGDVPVNILEMQTRKFGQK